MHSRSKVTLMMLSLLLLAPSLFSGEVRAGAAEAEDCLRNKVWEGYADGWSVRTATTAALKAEESRVYVVTLYANTEYRILVCADEGAANIDVVLHNADGVRVLTEEEVGRQPMLSYVPEASGTYYIALHATALEYASARTSVGMAVTYR